MSETPSAENQGGAPDPFTAAAATDSQLVQKRTALAHIDDRLVILREQMALGHVSRISAELEEEQALLLADVRDREGFLREIWQEARGDVGAFSRLVNVRDWQHQAETTSDPQEREEALSNFNRAREELDSYLYDPDYQEPRDEE